MSDSGWKPAPPDPYWSLPESQGGPSRFPTPGARPGRPLPRSLPQQAPPPSALAARLSIWGTAIFIPVAIYYTVFLADYGPQEHIYSPARRWLKEQKEKFFTLTPEQRRLTGIAQPSSETVTAVAAEPTPIDFTPAAPSPVTPAPSTEPTPLDMEKLRERARSRWWGFK
ncbi:hypothetical protein CALVIDRAFT_563326 [Calocera viscosa TUFC12733]|uniref:Transmembrane protein n=1 Tax=Calocera viscosa (strain TUFC12733) TaxID=1330018 RepID=A0A167MW14_CALVF|nr:hypothetical protein CALVIDRAFT_563326 [Calocera viscosa TUFC12733]